MDVYKEWLGIPEGERPPDHYQLLRLVQFEDDFEKIRNNYRKLNAHVRQYASGKYSNQSQELLNELAKGMLCLTDAHRKREYDEAQGRAFVEEASQFAHHSMEEILVNQKHISVTQMKEARDYANERGLSLRDAVVQMKLVDATCAQQALAEELGYSFIELNETVPDDSILDQITLKVVKRNMILPLFIDDDRLLVACIDDPDANLEAEIRFRYKKSMRPVLVTPLAMNQAIDQYYAPGMREEEANSGKQNRINPQQQSEPLSKEEQRKKKMMAGMFVLWSIILAGLIYQFVPIYVALLIPVVVATWVLLVYLKEE